MSTIHSVHVIAGTMAILKGHILKDFCITSRSLSFQILSNCFRLNVFTRQGQVHQIAFVLSEVAYNNTSFISFYSTFLIYSAILENSNTVTSKKAMAFHLIIFYEAYYYYYCHDRYHITTPFCLLPTFPFNYIHNPYIYSAIYSQRGTFSFFFISILAFCFL